MSGPLDGRYRDEDFVGRSFSGDSFLRCFNDHPMMNPHLKKNQRKDQQIIREFASRKFVNQENVNIVSTTQKIVKEARSNKEKLGLSRDSDPLIKANYVSIQMALLDCANSRG